MLQVPHSWQILRTGITGVPRNGWLLALSRMLPLLAKPVLLTVPLLAERVVSAVKLTLLLVRASPATFTGRLAGLEGGCGALVASVGVVNASSNFRFCEHARAWSG